MNVNPDCDFAYSREDMAEQRAEELAEELEREFGSSEPPGCPEERCACDGAEEHH